ncbi:Uncharacterized protein, UPF0261 family [Streptoalloteichus tenebrarius]|uniref:Uncharacterized protein, UPF0261 family n=1 Tax=Streptoalloteichus tenebrarius (strain ATCC 17920 / DSM 40477 / JCM 4838 / CBS 697.72 / NBRC 16177 / NCIMB 11028 / NRRL B-12390 / A12253. 1 / ISP 5477) TaxID=1933 RepID=A0ABT1HWQ3_STRSD|nr:Tm-1-like ATP-binding domain-containing protein [Streptoalloteichus tenebrarius]MCP2259958.1 Uncharacterized protein, UPF0261 family [Streptoalloteichus tenebrarius]BFF03283.1 Tm-1-like ATP-binding domain-containing protein [Streptoalloteichus tenebrarius]
MTTVVLVGTLDTKGTEFAWLAERVRAAGCETVLVDSGVMGAPLVRADIDRAEVAAAAGHDLAALRARGDRNAAVRAMAEGAAQTLRRLHAEGRLHAALSLGGSCGSVIASTAMRALPVGVPKLLVSTMAAGDCAPFVGSTDMTLMHSVLDIAGINRFSERILGNAASAAASMAIAYRAREGAEAARAASGGERRPLVATTMFGVTTPGVTAARRRLEELGYEVLVFHANGTGGRALEELAGGDLLAGVLDLTTTELADDLMGGVLSAGPRRLEAAGRAGLPQVVSLGALDMVNFGARETVPERLRHRTIHEHNPTVTVVRLTAAEQAELGRRIAAKLVAATGPVRVLVPLGGLSAYDAPGQPFHDPEADRALVEALRAGVAGSHVELCEIAAHINDERFGHAAAEHFHDVLSTSRLRQPLTV